MLLNTVDIRYLEYPPSQILTILSFLFGPFSIPFNFPYKSGISNSAISNFHYVEQFKKLRQEMPDFEKPRKRSRKQ